MNICVISWQNTFYTIETEVYNMERKVGTISRGIRCPIIREGDNLVDIAVTSV